MHDFARLLMVTGRTPTSAGLAVAFGNKVR
jgi:hypothetical protein